MYAIIKFISNDRLSVDSDFDHVLSKMGCQCQIDRVFCIKENLMSYPELRAMEHFSLFMSMIVVTKNIGSLSMFRMHENKINNFYSPIIFYNWFRIKSHIFYIYCIYFVQISH